MALRNVANTGRTIIITPNGVWVPGTPTYTQFPESRVKAAGNSVLKNAISWTMALCVFPPNVFISGSGSMPATAQKVKVGNVATSQDKPPMRMDDQGTCNGLFQPPGGPPPPPPVPCNCTFRITAAGQTKVKAE